MNSPLGFYGGDTNLYRFVGDEPTNATDPTGLETKKYVSDDNGKDASSGLMGLDKNQEMPFGNGKLKIAVRIDVNVTYDLDQFDTGNWRRAKDPDYIKFVISSTATNRSLSDVHFIQFVTRKVTPNEGKKLLS
jgi:hypothetical protein